MKIVRSKHHKKTCTNNLPLAKATDDKFLYQGDILMNVDGLPASGQQTKKKRAVVAFEYLRWDVNQGVPYKLDKSLNGEFLVIGATVY